jgi:hypothetical protein
MKVLQTILVAFTVFISACSTTQQSIIPVTEKLPTTSDNYTIVWVGTGESYRYEEGQYLRDSSNDYTFEVIQRRYGNRWKSVKNMHRLHPAYNGKAGPREQTMFFEIDFKESRDSIVSRLTSSLGNGSGTSDEEFRRQVLEFNAAGVSGFAPYNRYRITQNYAYEQGRLTETVELFKQLDSGNQPFAQIKEEAQIFRPTELQEAPTRFNWKK